MLDIIKKDNTYIIKNIDPLQINWFKQVALANDMNIVKTEWQSIYNSFVKYEYEPFVPKDFTIILTLAGNQNVLDFIEYLYDLKMECIKLLNKCLLSELNNTVNEEELTLTVADLKEKVVRKINEKAKREVTLDFVQRPVVFSTDDLEEEEG